jgi:hypothetical protein
MKYKKTNKIKYSLSKRFFIGEIDCGKTWLLTLEILHCLHVRELYVLAQSSSYRVYFKKQEKNLITIKCRQKITYIELSIFILL